MTSSPGDINLEEWGDNDISDLLDDDELERLAEENSDPDENQPLNLGVQSVPVSGMNSPRSAGFSAGEETSLRRQRNPPEMATDRWQGSHGSLLTSVLPRRTVRIAAVAILISASFFVLASNIGGRGTPIMEIDSNPEPDALKLWPSDNLRVVCSSSQRDATKGAGKCPEKCLKGERVPWVNAGLCMCSRVSRIQCQDMCQGSDMCGGYSIKEDVQEGICALDIDGTCGLEEGRQLGNGYRTSLRPGFTPLPLPTKSPTNFTSEPTPKPAPEPTLSPTNTSQTSPTPGPTLSPTNTSQTSPTPGPTLSPINTSQPSSTPEPTLSPTNTSQPSPAPELTLSPTNTSQPFPVPEPSQPSLEPTLHPTNTSLLPLIDSTNNKTKN